MQPQRAPISRDELPQDLLARHAADILRSPGMDVERRCIQHGDTTVFQHSVAVTLRCVAIAQALAVPVSERDLVRGALLHDYFLYDWHVPDPSHRLHGFRHPFFARMNAERDFGLTPIQRDMVVHHMFPLVPAPPHCREAWILTLADKCVASHETAHGFALKASRLAGWVGNKVGLAGGGDRA